MAVKKITIRYLCEITGLSVDSLSHKLGYHTTHAYRLLAKNNDLLESTKAREVLSILEEYQISPFEGKQKMAKF